MDPFKKWGAITAIFLQLLSLPVYIAALVIAGKYPDPDCDGKMVPLPTWLNVYGGVGIIGGCIKTCVALCFIRKPKVVTGVIGGVIITFDLMWVISWNVVGAVALFRDSLSCQEDATQVWETVLALLIIGWVSMLCILWGCCCNRADPDDTQTVATATTVAAATTTTTPAPTVPTAVQNMLAANRPTWAAAKHCTKCGNGVDAADKFCAKCGTNCTDKVADDDDSAPATKNMCLNCFKKTDPVTHICPSCGRDCNNQKLFADDDDSVRATKKACMKCFVRTDPVTHICPQCGRDCDNQKLFEDDDSVGTADSNDDTTDTTNSGSSTGEHMGDDAV